MYFLLSPAKNLNEAQDIELKQHTLPVLLDEAELLMQDVRPLSPQAIANLMHVSDKIALLNAERNAQWHTPFTPQNAKAALYLFNGDVYEGIDAHHRSEAEINYIHQHVRILSGLYGILRPLDLIQPYRLEMGTPLANSRGKNLYQFWGERITEQLNASLNQTNSNIIVNVASQEYFKVIQPKKLNARIITPVFQDEKNGRHKIISFYAKRARGLMVRYAAENAIDDVEQLKAFDLEGYRFNAAASADEQWVFQRPEQPE